MDTDEGQYKAMPQTQGKVAHQITDRKTASNRADDILSLPVYSEEYGLMGKIDVYRRKDVIIFDVTAVKLKKYGNAIHRDTDIVYF